MIIVEQLSKNYNGTAVLNIAELEIPKGQSFGLVGNNGAGKTTFFSLLLDLIQPTTGRVVNNDVDFWRPSSSGNAFTTSIAFTMPIPLHGQYIKG